MLKVVLQVVENHTEMERLRSQPPESTPSTGVPRIETLTRHERPGEPQRLVLVERRTELELPIDGAAEAGGGVDESPHGTIGALLEARHLIDDNDPLIVAEGALWIDIDIGIDALVTRMLDTGSDGLVVALPSEDAGATRVRRDSRGYVTRVVEHDDRSNTVAGGMCVFRRGRDFVRGAEALATDRVPVALVYNTLIDDGARITVWEVSRDAATVLDLRRRSDLERVLVNVCARRTTAA